MLAYIMHLADAVALFRRLGIDVSSLSRGEFRTSYRALAKRYHPDRNPEAAELMANINAARAAILRSYREAALKGYAGR
jgi:curved DNA-binding protein CbpA